MEQRLLTVSLPPHIHAPGTTAGAMWRVVVALIPALACSMWVFGLGAAVVTVISVLACMGTEYFITRFMLKRRPTLGDGSAALTGLLLAMNLPSNLPPWIIVIGAVVAIGIGKMAFGGLGCNIFNPALVGRVFLLLSFPVQMTSWPLPGVGMEYLDAATGATVLGAIKMGELSASDINVADLLVGNTGGSLGEVGALALIVGGLFLVLSKVITWHIPVSVVVSAALFSLCIGGYCCRVAVGRIAPWCYIYGYGLCHVAHDPQRNADIWSRNRYYNHYYKALGRISRRCVVCHIAHEWLHAID